MLFYLFTIDFRFKRVKPWPNGLASWRKSTQVCKIRTCVRTCDQMDSQVDSEVSKSRKFHAYPHWLMRFITTGSATNLCPLALGGQTVKKTCIYLRPIWARSKSTQVGGQTKRNQNLRRLASPFGQGFRDKKQMSENAVSAESVYSQHQPISVQVFGKVGQTREI